MIRGARAELAARGIEGHRTQAGVRRTLPAVLADYSHLGLVPATIIDVGVGPGTPELYERLQAGVMEETHALEAVAKCGIAAGFCEKLRKRRTTGARKGMEGSYVEDLASHDGPGHALVIREGAAKRWIRGARGRALEPRK